MPGPYEYEAYTVCLRRDTTTGVVVSEAWYFRDEDKKKIIGEDIQDPERYVRRDRVSGEVKEEKFYRDDRLRSTREYGPILPVDGEAVSRPRRLQSSYSPSGYQMP